ncbi:hypothetical protein Q3G72_031574 [Acer saccharum]|nr:hypothetical protein Q3G72_031574 [Acer saccharum]
MGLLRMTFSGEIVSLLYPSGSSEQDRGFVHKPKKKPLWKNGRFQAQLVSGDRFGHVAEVTKTNQGIDLCIDLRGVATDTLQGMKGKCITEETPQGRRPRFQTMWVTRTSWLTTEEPVKARLLNMWKWNDIRKSPTFRSQFHATCAKVGVDPLASNKGF